MESIVEYFFIGKQKVILFPKYRENGWESAASALTVLLLGWLTIRLVNIRKFL
jgi:hypothetical protein